MGRLRFNIPSYNIKKPLIIDTAIVIAIIAFTSYLILRFDLEESLYAEQLLLTSVLGICFLFFALRRITENRIRIVSDEKTLEEMVKHRPETLAGSEESYHAIFESANDGIIIRDIRDYHIVDINNKACEIFCYPKEELVGLGIEATPYCSNQYSRQKIKEAYDAVAEGKPQIFECSATDKFGREFWIEVNAKRAIINGQYRILSIIRDITERKQAIGIKEDFMNMVSHELRTPLSAIKEGVSLLMDERGGVLEKEKQDILNIARKNIDRLTRLINQVLDFQKLDSGVITFNFEKNDINEAISEVYRTMLSETRKNGLEFIVKLDNTLPSVNFDRDRIVEVLSNLTNNAIKYTKEGRITISSKKGNNFIQVSVCDTGCGIRQCDIPKLFKRFSQLERKTGGSGLGLAISKEIIDIHKGKIWAESNPGKGASFNFLLPIEERRV